MVTCRYSGFLVVLGEASIEQRRQTTRRERTKKKTASLVRSGGELRFFFNERGVSSRTESFYVLFSSESIHLLMVFLSVEGVGGRGFGLLRFLTFLSLHSRCGVEWSGDLILPVFFLYLFSGFMKIHFLHPCDEWMEGLKGGAPTLSPLGVSGPWIIIIFLRLRRHDLFSLRGGEKKRLGIHT